MENINSVFGLASWWR